MIPPIVALIIVSAVASTTLVMSKMSFYKDSIFLTPSRFIIRGIFVTAWLSGIGAATLTVIYATPKLLKLWYW